ncbi:hypothetical protein [Metapseudomonas furukawaii]|uniref:hypothetical protein n=1 Tax=Metapseudomonas furukawaii TaxID=1149133 RepID=UPI00103EF992|nr:hypothetical protein [Pseudomonas furukawaii]
MRKGSFLFDAGVALVCLLPPTLLYVVGAVVVMRIIHKGLVGYGFFSAAVILAGIGLATMWWLAFNYRTRTLASLPLLVKLGLVSGLAGFAMLLWHFISVGLLVVIMTLPLLLLIGYCRSMWKPAG